MKKQWKIVIMAVAVFAAFIVAANIGGPNPVYIGRDLRGAARIAWSNLDGTTVFLTQEDLRKPPFEKSPRIDFVGDDSEVDSWLYFAKKEGVEDWFKEADRLRWEKQQRGEE